MLSKLKLIWRKSFFIKLLALTYFITLFAGIPKTGSLWVLFVNPMLIMIVSGLISVFLTLAFYMGIGAFKEYLGYEMQGELKDLSVVEFMHFSFLLLSVLISHYANTPLVIELFG